MSQNPFPSPGLAYPWGMERVPPGQRVTERFPILTYGEEPRVSKEAWRLDLFGLVEAPLGLTYADLLAFPQVDLTRDFHCVTGWSRLDAAWRGVRVRDLLERARPRPEAWRPWSIATGLHHQPPPGGPP